MASGPHQAGRCMHQACPLAHRLAQAATGHLFQPWLPNVPPSSHRHPQPPPGSTYGISSWTTVSWRAWGASFSIAALQGGGGNTGSGHTPGPANPTFITCPKPSSSSAGPSPFRCSPSLQEDRPGPGSPRPPSPLWVRAHPCCQEHPARASKTRKISGFWSKAPCASGARGKLSSGAKSGMGTSHQPSLQGCRGSPAGRAFHLPQAPPAQGHNKTG